jgi:iron complex outermembrane receptor protein
MRLNGAVFYQEFDDFITRLTRLNVRQLDDVITQSGITDNADAQISGAELDFDVMLSENWHLGGGVSYIDAQFKSGGSLPCNEFDDDGNPLIPEGQTAAYCDVGGHSIGSQPNWSASVNTEYAVPLDDFEGYARGLYRFVGDRPTEDLGTQSAYSTLELYVGVRGEHWDVSVFARNLFDEEAIINGSFATQQVRRTNTGYGTRNLLQERLFGLTASYWF